MSPTTPDEAADRVPDPIRPHLLVPATPAPATREPLAETLLAIAQAPRAEAGLRSLPETIDAVCGRLEEAMGYDRVVVVPVGPLLEGAVDALPELEELTWRRVIERSQSGLATVVDLRERAARDVAAAGRKRSPEWRAAVFAPLLVRGQLVGALGCLHKRAHACDAEEVEAVQAVARMTASAIDVALAGEAMRLASGSAEADRAPASRGFPDRLLEAAAITGGDPVQRLCDLLSGELAAPVVVWDLRGRKVRAAAGTDELREKVGRALRGRGHAQVARLEDGAPLAGGVSVPIDRGERLGLLVAGIRAPGDAATTDRLRQAAVIIGLALDAELARNPDRNLSRPSTLHALVSGRLSPRQAHDVASYVDATGQPLRIGFLRVDDPVTATATSHRVNFTLRIPGCLAAAAERDGVVLLLEDAEPATIQAMIPSLLATSGSRWALGVSEAFTDLSNAHDALNQAQVALASTADQHVAYYDTMGPTVDLLKHLQPGAATRFVDELLSPLLEYDRAHSAALTETLDAYLRNRCSLRGAAADLYVHTNTVQLRLARAAAVTGMDLHDPRQLGLLSIAFAWRSHWATEDPDAARQG